MAKSKHIPDDLWSLPRTAAVARRLGSKFYFTGERCLRGHLAPKATGNQTCQECANEDAKQKTAETAPARAVAAAAQREATRAAEEAERQALIGTLGLDVVLGYEEAQQIAVEQDQRDRTNARSKERRIERMDKVGAKAVRKEEADSVRKAYRADPQKQRDRINKKHRAGKTGYRYEKTKTPPWLTDEERAEMEYIKATCPEGWEVDHIVPRDDHPLIVGLHVPWNLQHLSPAQNNQRRRGCSNEFRCTLDEAADYVARGMAVWRKDVAEDGTIDWSKYPRPKGFERDLFGPSANGGRQGAEREQHST